MANEVKKPRKVHVIEVKDGTEIDSPFLTSTPKNQSWIDQLSGPATEEKPKKKKIPKYDIEIIEEPTEKTEEPQENSESEDEEKPDDNRGPKIFSRLFFFISLFITVLTCGILACSNLLPETPLLILTGAAAFVIFLFGEFSFRSCTKPTSKTICGFLEIAFSALFALSLITLLKTVNFVDSVQKPIEEYPFSDVSVSKSAFNILYINSDSEGEIKENAENDTVSVITINPVAKKIQVTNIPTGLSLSPAESSEETATLRSLGTSGVGKTAESLASFLNIKFNYYIHTNFTTLKDFIDAIDGINLSAGTYLVLEEEEKDLSCTFYQTKSTRQTGSCAVAFLREPKAYGENREKQLENHEKVFASISKRLMTKDAFLNYLNVLDAVQPNLETNIPSSRLIQFANFEIKNLPNWQFQTFTLEGEMKKTEETLVFEPTSDSLETLRLKLSLLQ